MSYNLAFVAFLLIAVYLLGSFYHVPLLSLVQTNKVSAKMLVPSVPMFQPPA